MPHFLLTIYINFGHNYVYFHQIRINVMYVFTAICIELAKCSPASCSLAGQISPDVGRPGKIVVITTNEYVTDLQLAYVTLE